MLKAKKREIKIIKNKYLCRPKDYARSPQRLGNVDDLMDQSHSIHASHRNSQTHAWITRGTNLLAKGYIEEATYVSFHASADVTPNQHIHVYGPRCRCFSQVFKMPTSHVIN